MTQRGHTSFVSSRPPTSTITVTISTAQLMSVCYKESVDIQSARAISTISGSVLKTANDIISHSGTRANGNTVILPIGSSP